MSNDEKEKSDMIDSILGKFNSRIQGDPIGSAKNPINDAQNSFVSVYGCPVETPVNPPIGGGSRGVFDQYLIPPPHPYREAGVPFMSGYGMSESIRIKRIKDLLTVSEYEVLMSTTVFCPVEQIIQYRDVLTKLIQHGVFDDKEENDDGSGNT